MNNSNSNRLNILDLHDEILFIILNKLRIVDVFYSLADVNRRFHRLGLDSLYIHHLDMTSIVNINSFYHQSSTIEIEILSNICSKVLPKIDHHVHKITIEQDSMKLILPGNYCQLYSLSLINFQVEILHHYLTDGLVLRDFLSKQITHLSIDMKNATYTCSKTVANIFALVVSLCNKLTVLNFGDMFIKRDFDTPFVCLGHQRNMSSTLTNLKINVCSFVDCLFVLDGRFECLSTLIINVSSISDDYGDLGGREKLLKLKCFSFTTFHFTDAYDNLIVPLLCRMINLEELQLFLDVVRIDGPYIDGIQLYDQFLTYMTQLKKFTFSIESRVWKESVEVELLSNEDIQRSFIGKGYQQVVSYISTEYEEINSRCRMYSLPYDFKYYFNLNNSFQSGMFDKVRQLKMSYESPIKYKIFPLISRDFPFLEFLLVSNGYPMEDKQDSSTPITFLFLTNLELRCAHSDFIELLLLRKNTHLPCFLNLSMDYHSLINITNNFTNDAIDFNFGTLKSIDVHELFVRPANFPLYFPLL